MRELVVEDRFNQAKGIEARAWGTVVRRGEPVFGQQRRQGPIPERSNAGVALYLNRRLRSQGVHDLNTVNHCT